MWCSLTSISVYLRFIKWEGISVFRKKIKDILTCGIPADSPSLTIEAVVVVLPIPFRCGAGNLAEEAVLGTSGPTLKSLQKLWNSDQSVLQEEVGMVPKWLHYPFPSANRQLTGGLFFATIGWSTWPSLDRLFCKNKGTKMRVARRCVYSCTAWLKLQASRLLVYRDATHRKSVGRWSPTKGGQGGCYPTYWIST